MCPIEREPVFNIYPAGSIWTIPAGGFEMRNRRILYIVMCSVFVLTMLFSTTALAQEGPEGNTYYCFTADLGSNSAKHFTLNFTETGSDETETDNETGETDNATTWENGTVSISVENKTFDNETGMYRSLGLFFNGVWEAVEVNYSSFYQENIYTYYSYVFTGVTFANDLFATGMIFSTLTEESVSKGKVVKTGLVPFAGMLVAVSTRRGEMMKK